MARLPSDQSQQLERHEGGLGCLASALVLLDLVETRVGMAARQQPGLLCPVLDDVQRARRLIRKAQAVPGLDRRLEGS